MQSATSAFDSYNRLTSSMQISPHKSKKQIYTVNLTQDLKQTAEEVAKDFYIKNFDLSVFNAGKPPLRE